MDTVGYQLGMLFLFAVYLLPSIIAGRKEHRNCHAICVLNVLLGWTLLFWVIALVWACMDSPKPQSKAEEYAELLKQVQALQGGKK